MAHQVFISYSHIDNQIANALCNKLEDEGTKCWIAPRDIRPGASWAGEIADAIPASKVLIIILSSDSNASEQVIREVEIAIYNKLVIIPIRIEDMMPTGGMSYFLSNTHWIDILDKNIDNKIAVLSGRIKSILGIVEEGAEPKKTIIASPAITVKTKETDENKQKVRLLKTNLRNRIVILSSIAIVVAVGLILFFLRDAFFKREDKVIAVSATKASITLTPSPEHTAVPSTPTPAATAVPLPMYKPEDFGYDPNMTVRIESDVLKEAIYLTLESIGKPAIGSITIEDMFNLRELLISDYEEISNPLYFLPESYDYLAEKFMCQKHDTIDNLSGIQFAYNLKVLMISDIAIENLNLLKGLESLEILMLSENQGQLSDINALSGLENLRVFEASDTLIDDISALSNLENLTHLFIQENNLTDISAIAELPNIEFLSISQNAESSNHSYISNLSYFKSSDIMKNCLLFGAGDNNIENIDFLSDAYNLYNLNLMNNNISDISILAQLTNLKELYLAGNNIEDISVLSKLTNLQFLSLNGNKFNDISVLESLENLKILFLDTDVYNNNLETINMLKDRGCQINTE